MGCGQKKVAEDEDDWDAFQRAHSIEKMPWKVYSRQSHWAEEGYAKFAFQGDVLIKYVKAREALDLAGTIFEETLIKLKAFQSI